MPETRRYGGILFQEQTAASTPPTGFVALYPKADGLFYSKDDAGLETVVTGAGGGGFPLLGPIGTSVAPSYSFTGATSTGIHGKAYANFPGSANSYMTTPDHATLDITGDLEVQVKVAPADWTPSGNNVFFAKHTNLTPTSGGYNLVLLTTGVLQLQWSDGTSSLNKSSTVAVSFVDGTAHWVKATLDVNNGAAGHDVAFYTSEDGQNWTQLGTTVTTAGTTSIAANATNLTIGASTLAANLLTGKLYEIRIYNGISGTLVANPKFYDGVPGATTVTDSLSKVYTINGTGSVAFTADNSVGITANGVSPVEVNSAGLSMIQGQLIVSPAGASAPGLSFTNDTNTGIYSPSADQIGFTTQGTLRLSIGTSTITSVGMVFNGGNGLPANPVYSFTSDPDTGLYLNGVGDVRIVASGSTAGVPAQLAITDDGTNGSVSLFSRGTGSVGFFFGFTNRLSVNNTLVTATVPFVGANGSVGAPTFSFSGDPNTGMYGSGADDLFLATAGTERIRITSTGRLALNMGADPRTDATAEFKSNVGASSGNTNYLFRASSGSAVGIALETDFPSIGFNHYYQYSASLHKSIGLNYAAANQWDPTNALLTWSISTASAGAADTTLTMTNRMTLSASGLNVVDAVTVATDHDVQVMDWMTVAP